MRHTTMTRRRLLKTLAAGSAFAALPMFQSGRLMASPGDVPLRIVFFYLPTGIMQSRGKPIGRGNDPVTQTAWELDDVFAPLAPYKDRINFFQNLDMVSAKNDPTGASNAHASGITHAMTGDWRVAGKGGRARGISIDQYIAEQLYVQKGVLTRTASLEVGECSSWDGQGNGVASVRDIEDLYRRAFGAAGLSQGELRAAQSSSMIIGGQLDNLIKRLGARDRQVIEAHREKHALMVARLKADAGVRQAYAPDRATFDAILDRHGYSGEKLGWVEENALYSEMVALALHSDATRVASFGLRRPPGQMFGFVPGKWGGANSTHIFEHLMSARMSKLEEKGWREEGDAFQAQRLRHELEITELRKFLDLLDSLPETDGKTLLDHTLVVGVSHIASGTHSLDNLPWFTIGDAQGFLKTGQYVSYERREERKLSGRPHNDLFVSLIQAMGLDAMRRSRTDDSLDRFGLADACSGPILEIHNR